jgi:hypothetical protein
VLHRNNLAAARPGQRASNRLRLGVQASLQLTSETRPCLLDDISVSGARVRVDRKLAEGTIAVLNFHELHLYASVVWCHDGECGLRFDQRLPVEDMQGMLWITQNREVYDRMCRESGAEEWTRGIWE